MTPDLSLNSAISLPFNLLEGESVSLYRDRGRVGKTWSSSGASITADGPEGFNCLTLSNGYLSLPPPENRTLIHNNPLTLEAHVFLPTSGEYLVWGKMSSVYGLAYEHAFFVSSTCVHFYWGLRGSNQAHLKLIFPSALPLDSWLKLTIRRTGGSWSAKLGGVEATTYQYSPTSSGVSYGAVTPLPCSIPLNFQGGDLLTHYVGGSWEAGATWKLAFLRLTLKYLPYSETEIPLVVSDYIADLTSTAAGALIKDKIHTILRFPQKNSQGTPRAVHEVTTRAATVGHVRRKFHHRMATVPWANGRENIGINGSVAIKGTPLNFPVARPVYLYSMSSKLPVDVTMSQADGTYQFRYLNPSEKYYAVAFDPTGFYRPVVADNLPTQDFTV